MNSSAKGARKFMKSTPGCALQYSKYCAQLFLIYSNDLNTQHLHTKLFYYPQFEGFCHSKAGQKMYGFQMVGLYYKNESFVWVLNGYCAWLPFSNHKYFYYLNTGLVCINYYTFMVNEKSLLIQWFSCPSARPSFLWSGFRANYCK